MILKVLGAKFFLLDFLSVHVSFFHFPFALLLNPNVHVEPLLYIYILILCLVSPQNNEIRISRHEAQAATFLESSPSNTNIQPRVRTTALILGGSRVL